MEKHEQIYRKLKESGYKGWGGSNYENRINSWKLQLDRLLGKLRITNVKIAEFGCGAGDNSIVLARKGFEVTGVDISPSAINWAKEKALEENLEIEFITNNVCDETLLTKQKFDLIIDGNCLHCLFGEDRMAFYRNVKRVLECGGYLFISSAVRESAADIIPKISSIERCILPEKDLKKEIINMGFEIVEEWFSEDTHRHYYGVCRYINVENIT